MRYLKIFLFFLFILLLGCASKSGQNTAPAPTRTSTVKPVFDLQGKISPLGQVVPAKEYRLSFPTSGIVSELQVEEGDVVNPGDMIARLDTSSLAFDITKAETELALAQARLQKTLSGPPPVQITQAAIEVIVAHNLPQYLPRVEATAKAIQISAAEARLIDIMNQPYPEDVAVAQAEVDQARANLDKVKAELEKAVLISPIKGNVVQVVIRKGEYADTGQPIVIISDLRDLLVETELAESDAIDLQIGDEAIISFETVPNLEVKGLVIDIKPTNKEPLGNFIVTIALNDPPPQVRWGMVANINFPDKNQ